MRGVALVTGAGSGIGLEITRALFRRGQGVLGVALGQRELDDLAGEARESGAQLDTLAIDLTQEGAVDRVRSHATARGREVSTLVNCAGMGLYGEHLALDDAAVQRMVALNVGALTELSTKLARRMVARGHGQILNVASTAAFQPLPRLCAYTATKHYVAAFTLGLAEELRGTGVSVSLLCPGITDTPFIESSGIAGGTRTERLARRLSMTPEAVAEAAMSALDGPRGFVVAGRMNRAHYALSRTLPPRALTRVFERVTRATG
jgi:short-subunit dehydrogenase